MRISKLHYSWIRFYWYVCIFWLKSIVVLDCYDPHHLLVYPRVYLLINVKKILCTLVWLRTTSLVFLSCGFDVHHLYGWLWRDCYGVCPPAPQEVAERDEQKDASKDEEGDGTKQREFIRSIKAEPERKTIFKYNMGDISVYCDVGY